jgi:4-hydroxy-tetrahydrodipicolinate reductase
VTQDRAPLRVAVSGAQGRTGREVVAALAAEPGFECVAGIGAEDDLGAELRRSGARVLVDFTTPQAGLAHALTAVELGVSPVVGTSGLGQSGTDRIRDACAAAGLGGCVIANFALGAALLMWLADLCAPYFEMCEIIEAHQAGKLDAPSGTALRTAERLLAARGGRAFQRSEAATTTLAGTRGGSLGGASVHSLRLEGVVADQEVIFGALGQSLALVHRTTSRAAFAPGVLLASRAVAAEDAPFFDSLEGVLGLPPAASLQAGAVPSSIG